MSLHASTMHSYIQLPTNTYRLKLHVVTSGIYVHTDRRCIVLVVERSGFLILLHVQSGTTSSLKHAPFNIHWSFHPLMKGVFGKWGSLPTHSEPMPAKNHRDLS